MYSVGDYVVKVNNGVCRVEDIMEMESFGRDQGTLYYLLIPQEDKGAKLYVPVEREREVLRQVISKADAQEMIRRIPKIEAEWSSNDKQRELEYKEALHSCEPELLVRLLKHIYLRRQKRSAQGKKSTMVDDRYFRLAEQALHSELAFALGCSQEEIGGIIRDAAKGEQE